MGMRFAGSLLKKLGPNFAKAFPKSINGTPLPGRGIMGSILPDVGFGVMSGMMTPGDLGDKLIAGTTDAVVGAGLTGGLRGVVRAKPGRALSTVIEYGGGMGAGMASMPLADQLLRIKGGGMSPYDKLQQEQYEGMREQIKQDLYDQMMRSNRPGYIGNPFPPTNDPFLVDNGLS
jgi:hypothetical protein